MSPVKPLMALVHGLEATPATWRRFTGRLDDDYRIVALEMPWGNGGSPRWRRAGTAGQCLARALDALGERPDVLVGHSFGANAALEVVATSDAPVASRVVLLSPFFCAADLPVDWVLFDRARRNFEATINEGLASWFARRAEPLHEGVADAIARRVRDRVGPLAFATWFEQFTASGHLPLATIDTPMLALSGRDDPCLGSVAAAALAAATPALRVEVEPGFDHFCHIRQASQIAARVDAFHRDLAPAGLAHTGEGV